MAAPAGKPVGRVPPTQRAGPRIEARGQTVSLGADRVRGRRRPPRSQAYRGHRAGQPGATFHAPGSGVVHLTMLVTPARQPGRQAVAGNPGRALTGYGTRGHAEQGRWRAPSAAAGATSRRAEADPAEDAAPGPAAAARGAGRSADGRGAASTLIVRPRCRSHRFPPARRPLPVGVKVGMRPPGVVPLNSLRH